GNGADDELAATVPGERRAVLPGGGLEERANLGTRQRGHGLEANEAVLLARPQKNFLRIGKRRASIEGNAHAPRRRRDRDDGARRPLGGAVADDEEVVVVPDQLVRPRPAPAQRGARGANQTARLGVELGQEAVELPGGTRLGLHATSAAPRNCSS